MYDAAEVTSNWSNLYFICLLLIGNYVLIHLFVAIVVEGYATGDVLQAFSENVLGHLSN
jgi:hypothetical protein